MGTTNWNCVPWVQLTGTMVPWVQLTGTMFHVYTNWNYDYLGYGYQTEGWHYELAGLWGDSLSLVSPWSSLSYPAGINCPLHSCTQRCGTRVS